MRIAVATTEACVFDLRTNMPNSGERPLFTREHFQEFKACFGDDPRGSSPRVDQGEEGRFRIFSREQTRERGENLDISWLRDENAERAEDLPEPDEIAAEILGNLRVAMEEMEALTELLEVGE